MPGNRAHVDLLFQKFDEDANIDFDSLDIAVNAVATAVKDFFFKVLGNRHTLFILCGENLVANFIWGEKLQM